MNTHNFDSKALDIAQEIMRQVYGPMPIGGSVQLLAQVQVLVTDAMVYAAGQPARGGE